MVHLVFKSVGSVAAFLLAFERFADVCSKTVFLWMGGGVMIVLFRGVLFFSVILYILACTEC